MYLTRLDDAHTLAVSSFDAVHGAEVDEIAAVAVSLVIASVILLPFAAFAMPQRLPSALSLASIAALGLLSTAAALLLYFHRRFWESLY